MTFDPYHKWLGISKDRRPPTYYDLLGVEPGEGDTETLRSAVKQRRAFVQSKRGAGHDEEAKKILRQLDVAASTLLVTETMYEYDKKIEKLLAAHRESTGNRRRRSRVLPSVVETQVVRIYGEGSGLIGDFLGITAIIVAGTGLMAILASQMPRSALKSTNTDGQIGAAGGAIASGTAAGIQQLTRSDDDDSQLGNQLTRLNERQQQLVPVLEKARDEKAQIVAKLREAGVTGGRDLRDNPSGRRLAAALQQVAYDIEGLEREIEKLSEAIAYANSLKRRADQEQLRITERELAILMVSANDGLPAASADPVSLDVLLEKELGRSSSLDTAEGFAAVTTADRPIAEGVEKSQSTLANQLRLQHLAELGAGLFGPPWLSSDGLTIYWERDLKIWTAYRDSASTNFKGFRELVSGRQPTVSSDQLELIYVLPNPNAKGKTTLQVAVRRTPSEPFGKPRELTELRHESAIPKSPCLSHDGMSLYFNLQNPAGGTSLRIATRSSRLAAWGRMQTVPGIAEDGYTWPWISPDNLMLLCASETAELKQSETHSTLFVFVRRTPSDAFVLKGKIADPSLPALSGRGPRYVPSTGELFFARRGERNANGMFSWKGIWALHGFDFNRFVDGSFDSALRFDR